MLWAVEMYLDGIASAERISHLIGVCRGTIYNWVNRYREGGKEDLKKVEWSADNIQDIIDRYKDFYNYHITHIIYEYYDIFELKKRKKVFFIPYPRYANHF